MSAGYSPRSTGSRKSRLRLPSERRAAARSSAWSLAGAHRLEVEVDADPGRGDRGADRLDRPAVGEQEVVGGRDGQPDLTAPRGVLPLGVADPGGAPGLVQGDPHRYLRPQRAGHQGRVVGEATRGVAHRPPAGILERLGEVPVVEGQDRRDAAPAQPIDQAVVEVETRLVGRPAAAGLDPRPGHREAEGGGAQVGDQVEVLVEVAIVVGGDIAGVAVEGGAGGVAERVPDRRPPAVGVDRALDLVGGGLGPEEEAVGEASGRGAAGIRRRFLSGSQGGRGDCDATGCIPVAHGGRDGWVRYSSEGGPAPSRRRRVSATSSPIWAISEASSG